MKAHCAWLPGLALTPTMLLMDLLSIPLLFVLLCALLRLLLNRYDQRLCELDALW